MTTDYLYRMRGDDGLPFTGVDTSLPNVTRHLTDGLMHSLDDQPSMVIESHTVGRGIKVPGRKLWHSNGLKHRGNGPAVITDDGVFQYWINNEYIPESTVRELFADPRNPTKEELVILKLTY